jgi:hypothetical protein
MPVRFGLQVQTMPRRLINLLSQPCAPRMVAELRPPQNRSQMHPGLPVFPASCERGETGSFCTSRVRTLVHEARPRCLLQHPWPAERTATGSVGPVMQVPRTGTSSTSQVGSGVAKRNSPSLAVDRVGCGVSPQVVTPRCGVRGNEGAEPWPTTGSKATATAEVWRAQESGEEITYFLARSGAKRTGF